jgi:hypothetical protein
MAELAEEMKNKLPWQFMRNSFSARELLMKSSWKNLTYQEELSVLRKHGA